MAPKKQKANALTVTTGRSLSLPADHFPTLILDAGGAAQFAYEEFILGMVRNANTRIAYARAIRQFLSWCQDRSLVLNRIAPGDVGQYFDQHPGSPATKNQHLAAIRHLFDVMVNRHVVILNPAKSVRGERHSVIEGKTPEMTSGLTRRLLQSIDSTNIVGLRDYAIIATLAYTAARVGAVAKLKRSSIQMGSEGWSLKFSEKGGKHRVIPVRHDLKHHLARYLDKAGLEDAPKSSPLFRTTVRRERRLTKQGMSALAICRMFKRRLKDADLPDYLSPHGIRGGAATDLLEQGVPLEDVQYLLGHADPRTTRFYDHRKKRVTRNIVERISSVAPEES